VRIILGLQHEPCMHLMIYQRGLRNSFQDTKPLTSARTTASQPLASTSYSPMYILDQFPLPFPLTLLFQEHQGKNSFLVENPTKPGLRPWATSMTSACLRSWGCSRRPKLSFQCLATPPWCHWTWSKWPNRDLLFDRLPQNFSLEHRAPQIH